MVEKEHGHLAVFYIAMRSNAAALVSALRTMSGG
jgi:hypothetical protein